MHLLCLYMKLLEISTTHTKPLLKVVEFLKDIITEANIECTGIDSSVLNKSKQSSSTSSNRESEDNEEEVEESSTTSTNSKNTPGMRITAIDESATVLVNLKLEASKFTKFECKRPVMNLGVHLVWFYTILKVINNDENISLSVDREDEHNLNIDIINPDEDTTKNYKLKMLDLNDNKITVPDLQFDVRIQMNSTKFQKLCKEMDVISNYVEIKCTKDNITFTCKGDMIESFTQPYKHDPNIGVSISKSDKSPQVIQGIYELRRLVLFSKCSSLSTDIEIFMKNDFPLALKYTVATLGRIYLCLTPIDNIQNNQYNDELYEDNKVEYK